MLSFLLWVSAGVTAIITGMLIIGLIIGYVFDRKRNNVESEVSE